MNTQSVIDALSTRLGRPDLLRDAGEHPTARWGYTPGVLVTFDELHRCTRLAMRGNNTEITLYVSETIENFADAIVRCLAPTQGIVASMDVVVEVAGMVMGREVRLTLCSVAKAMIDALGGPSEYDGARGCYWLRTFKADSGGTFEAPAVHVGCRCSDEVYVIFERDWGHRFTHTIVAHSPECPDVESALSRDGSCTFSTMIEAAERVLA